jgi:proteasome alpha subunit
MTEEPYRWLEAVANRREYVEGQLKGGSPVIGVSLKDGILLLGVGTGQSKVFEIFDRHALAGLGHPADLERLRQAMIDAAHLEAFTRAPADVSLRRLVSFALGPQLKTAFEQIFSPPFLARLLLAELGVKPENDVLVRVDFDGTFALQNGGTLVVGDTPDRAQEAEQWLAGEMKPDSSLPEGAALALDAWRQLTSGEGGSYQRSDPATLIAAVGNRVLEAALLERSSPEAARYRTLEAADLGLSALRTS